MKIAILSTGNLNDMKGIMNYVHEKAKSYQNINDPFISVDLFFIVTTYSFLLSFLFRIVGRNVSGCKYKSGDIIEKDGIRYNILVRKQSIYNVIVSFFFNQFIPYRVIETFRPFLDGYDIISSHQLPCHYIAMILKRRYGMPYIATWHGSDINVSPRTSSSIFKITKHVIEDADMNYFVSQGLLNNSGYISQSAKKDVIYTGPSSAFFSYPDKEKLILREKMGLLNKKIVLFVGNIIPIKNVLVLPDIFQYVNNQFKKNDLEFLIIGNGSLEDELLLKLKNTDISFKMLGKIEPNIMPDYMNCADVLVLPSINEGFPLVILEARACGCNVVASNVGGLSEGAGEHNCFNLDDLFVKNIGNRIVEILINNEKPLPLPDEMSWNSAIKKEVLEISRILFSVKSQVN